MAAPTNVTSNGVATITATGEDNGVLIEINPITPNPQLTLVLGGTTTTVVVAIRARATATGLFAPIPVIKLTNNTVPTTSASITLEDSTTVAFKMDVAGFQAVEVYAVSGTPTSLTVNASIRQGNANAPITLISNTTTGGFTDITASGTLAVTGASTLTGAVTTGAAIVPATNDVGALGDATHGYADIFLGSGATINVANGNAVITHSSGIFTVSTGDLRVTTAGTNAASAVTVGGTQTLTNKTFTAPVIGAATGTSLAVTGALTSSGTAGIGYATGAGGTVTQDTNITTTVVLNKTTGTITTVSATLGAGVDASFTLTNSTIAATDIVVASIKSYGGTADGIPVVAVQATAAGSCILNIMNNGAVALDAVVVISFAVIKAVAA